MFLPNVPGATFIPGAMFSPESRVAMEWPSIETKYVPSKDLCAPVNFQIIRRL